MYDGSLETPPSQAATHVRFYYKALADKLNMYAPEEVKAARVKPKTKSVLRFRGETFECPEWKEDELKVKDPRVKGKMPVGARPYRSEVGEVKYEARVLFLLLLS